MLLFILGLCIGSFLNVLIHRIPKGESLVCPGSHCFKCGQSLKPLDLIPVLNYLLLRGRCRYCGAKISQQYLLVELLTGLTFMLVYLQYGKTVWTVAGCFFAAFLIIVTFTDVNEGIIPNKITYPGMLISLIFSFYTIGLNAALLGMLGFGVIFLFIAILSRGGIGGGDVKLVAVVGAFAGPINSILVFVLSSLAGGLWAIGLLLFTGAGRKTEIRFAPFLSLAGIVAYLYGSDFLNIYMSLF